MLISSSFIKNQKSQKAVIFVKLFCVLLLHVTVCDTKSIFSGRVPGTKWCGPGNDASNDTDFGERVDLDKCCYHHDRCDIRPLKKGLERFGLKNEDGYTKLHCVCEKQFVDCLRDVGDTSAIFVGKAYFRLQKHCFMEYYPILKCENRKTYTKYLTSRCLNYKYDKTAPIKYQWFDLPLFNENNTLLADAFTIQYYRRPPNE